MEVQCNVICEIKEKKLIKCEFYEKIAQSLRVNNNNNNNNNSSNDDDDNNNNNNNNNKLRSLEFSRGSHRSTRVLQLTSR